MAWAAAVLCGGASRRMGRDKALLVVDGDPMVVRVAAAAHSAGATTVIVIGGDEAGLGAALAGDDDVAFRPDRFPGEGPLGGLVTALGEVDEPVLLALACDLLDPDPAAMAATVAALAVPGTDVAVPDGDGRAQWLHAAWRRAAVTAPLAQRFAAGERSVHRAVAQAQLTVARVPELPARALADADSPDDLRRGT
jgi:molybdenum cofactor guanylyltransferase